MIASARLLLVSSRTARLGRPSAVRWLSSSDNFASATDNTSASTDNTITTNNLIIDPDKYYSGQVMKFEGAKGHGTIKVYQQHDDSKAPFIKRPVLVHRNDLVTDIPREKLPFGLPYLRRGERVKFKLQARPESGGYQAKEVVFANSSIIPAVRKNFLSSMEYRDDHYVGRNVKKIYQDPNMTDEHKAAAVKVIVESVQQNMQQAEEMLRRLGLNPDDHRETKFPPSL